MLGPPSVLNPCRKCYYVYCCRSGTKDNSGMSGLGKKHRNQGWQAKGIWLKFWCRCGRFLFQVWCLYKPNMFLYYILNTCSQKIRNNEWYQCIIGITFYLLVLYNILINVCLFCYSDKVQLDSFGHGRPVSEMFTIFLDQYLQIYMEQSPFTLVEW